MTDLKFKPVRHSHKEFLAKAETRKGFVEAYDALALEYQVATAHFLTPPPNCSLVSGLNIDYIWSYKQRRGCNR